MTPGGLRLTSGEEMGADVLVTATGLRLQLGGGAEILVDGEPVDVAHEHIYKGLMLSGVPNLALAMGYTNASWTLRADLSARWFTSLLRHLEAHELGVAVARYDEDPPGDRPLLDLASGYVRRAEGSLPRQGNARPWRVVQSYLRDAATMRFSRIDDGRLELR
jgi:monooxygenase